ncbi:hypothetical protein KY330_02905 [Candidatus Woesearchaeota archaeon]|nr:hypothetical protein [Candidatus Woesearchaeota archaeon]
MGIKDIYQNQYKKLLIIPMLILVLAIVQISMQYSHTGDFITKGIALKGGIRVETEQVLKPEQTISFLKSNFPDSEIYVTINPNNKGSVIEADIKESEVEDFKEVIEDKGITILSANTEDPTFSANFYRTMIIIIAIAFLLMGIVVFLSFRTVVPSFAVILSAFSDIIVTIAVFNLLGFKLLKGGLAAFLMLIGYSVDTDILLTNRVVKRKEGTVYERCISAMKTGLKMSITTIAAVAVAYFLAIPEDIKQIMAILLIGLLIDLINTWIQNSGILRWYMEKKHNG